MTREGLRALQFRDEGTRMPLTLYAGMLGSRGGGMEWRAGEEKGRQSALVCYCCQNNIPQTGWLQPTVYFSRLWRLHAHDRGVGRVSFW